MDSAAAARSQRLLSNSKKNHRSLRALGRPSIIATVQNSIEICNCVLVGWSSVVARRDDLRDLSYWFVFSCPRSLISSHLFIYSLQVLLPSFICSAKKNKNKHARRRRHRKEIIDVTSRQEEEGRG